MSILEEAKAAIEKLAQHVEAAAEHELAAIETEVRALLAKIEGKKAVTPAAEPENTGAPDAEPAEVVEPPAAE